MLHKLILPTLMGVQVLLGLPFLTYASDMIPKHWHRIEVSKAQVHVIDGDTFDVDLNQDQRFDRDQERVRMLYVDAPETQPSHKGHHPELGKAATEFLETFLKQASLVLWINPKEPYDRHHRMLALVQVGKQVLNLELIRNGHSYFDTRFGEPGRVEPYEQAEAQAFEARRGIWENKVSVKHYQKRLRAEGKVVRSTQYPGFIEKIWNMNQLQPKAHRGRFVRMEAALQKTPKRGKRGIEVSLKHPAYQRGFKAYVPWTRKDQHEFLYRLKAEDSVYLEGYIESHPDQLRIYRTHVIHPGN